MQIFEIFRKQADEGILKGITTAATDALSSAAHKYLGTNPQTYQTQNGTSAVNPYIGKETELRKISQPMVAQLAQQQFKNWNAALKNAGTDDPSKLDKITQDRLRTLMIKNASKTFDVYNLLNASDRIEPSYRQEAELAEKNIVDSINKIMSKPGQQTQQDWNQFASSAQEISMLSKMYSGHGGNITSDGKTYYQGSRPMDPTDPEDLKIITQALAKGQVANASARKPKSNPPESDSGPTPPASPTPLAPVSGPDAAAPTTTPQQSAVGVKQINQLIPKIRTRDLTSIKKNIDNTIAKRQKPAPVVGQTATAPSSMTNMAKQLTNKPTISSTGGKTTTTPTGLIHTAKPTTAGQPAWTGRKTKVGAPPADEYANLERRLQQAMTAEGKLK